MEKKDIEIPFGAFDSELGGFEYTIPEGYKAEIKDGKVVVRKTESEDEKISKEIIDIINSYDVYHLKIAGLPSRIPEYIAWLEKQGEKGTNGNKGEFPIPEPPLTIKHAKEVMGIEQKPAWSEEEEEMIRYIGNAITTNDATQYLNEKGICIIDAHVWFEKLKDRVQPQNTWKPSEEQIMVVNRLRHCFLSDVSGNDIVILDALLEQLKEL